LREMQFSYVCGCSHRNTDLVFRLVYPVYGMNKCIFKVNVFTGGSYIPSTQAHTHREPIREFVG